MVEKNRPIIVARKTTPYIAAIVAINAAFRLVVAGCYDNGIFARGVSVEGYIFVAIARRPNDNTAFATASVLGGVFYCEACAIGQAEKGLVEGVAGVFPIAVGGSQLHDIMSAPLLAAQ